VEKNFEDKIFFFEPANKFYDLIGQKELVADALQLYTEESKSMDVKESDLGYFDKSIEEVLRADGLEYERARLALIKLRTVER